MEKSETTAEIFKSLAKAQSEITDAIKDTDNPFFKSKYADLSQVRSVVRAIFGSHGLSIVHMPTSSEAGLGLRTIIAHESGEYVSSVSHWPLQKKDAQGMGSALTYARRYIDMSISGMAADDDDGNDASRPTEPKPAKPATPHAINFMPADGKPADNARITEMGRDLYKHIKASKSVDDIVKWIEMNSEALLCLKAIDEKAYGAIIQLRDKREEELSNVSK